MYRDYKKHGAKIPWHWRQIWHRDNIVNLPPALIFNAILYLFMQTGSADEPGLRSPWFSNLATCLFLYFIEWTRFSPYLDIKEIHLRWSRFSHLRWFCPALIITTLTYILTQLPTGV